MKRFPEFIRNNMDYTGSNVTCLPVKFDSGDWESAIFFQLGGVESKEDRRALSRTEQSVPVAVESDLIKHNNAAVIMIRLEVFTREADPLVGEVLLTPGAKESHFETIKLLSTQQVLRWFFADAAYWIIHSQQNQLGAAEHAVFQEVMNDATQHDALIRMTGSYDFESALNEIFSHYEFRSSNSLSIPGSTRIQ